jgi:hypothetical protein
MSDAEFQDTFRIVGPVTNPRKRVSTSMAFDAYRTCDPRARVYEEAYLGVFSFAVDFRAHLERTRSTRGFEGATWSPYIWFDVDRDETAGGVSRAIADAGRLMSTLEERYGVPLECMMPFISGGKGCHVGLPTALWSPAGGAMFHLVSREFALRVAAAAGVTIDTAIYDRVRAFRAPNSRHPKTGLHKRFVRPEQFGLLTLEDAIALASRPAAFELPDLNGCGTLPALADEWQAAAEAVAAREEVLAERRRDIEAGISLAHVNRLTIDLIRGETVPVGQRNNTVYSASRNLAEAGASQHLIRELLREPSLDTGLPPREVDKTLERGFTDGTRKPRATDTDTAFGQASIEEKKP